jgi:nucleotide-binding universal stress UspA family protein
MNVRRIVVGLELGKLSDQAVARAMSLAREFGAQLEVVHGAGVEGGSSGAPRKAFFAEHAANALARAREAARGKLEMTVEDPVYAELPVDEYLRVSPLPGAHAILQRARELDADLIVIGAHRRRKPFDFGGTGRAVLATSPCSVWVEPAEGGRFEGVLAPIDLSPSTDLVLRAARSIAGRFVVPVRVMHVFTPPQFAYDPAGNADRGPTYVIEGLREEERAATRELVAAFDWGALPVRTEFTEGDPAETIVEHAGDSDLIVMGTHGTGVVRTVLGSCAYRVLKLGTGPMLVVPQREEHERE